MMVLEIDRHPHLEEEIARNQNNTCYRLSFFTTSERLRAEVTLLSQYDIKGI